MKYFDLKMLLVNFGNTRRWIFIEGCGEEAKVYVTCR